MDVVRGGVRGDSARAGLRWVACFRENNRVATGARQKLVVFQLFLKRLATALAQ